MGTITEDYISFETAKLLKEKGFDERCTHYYKNEKYLVDLGYTNIHSYTNSDLVEEFAASTLQMAMKWLREVHNLHIDVDPSEGDWNPTVLELENWSCAVKFGDKIPIQDSYEEAAEVAIKYCLEHLI